MNSVKVDFEAAESADKCSSGKWPPSDCIASYCIVSAHLAPLHTKSCLISLIQITQQEFVPPQSSLVEIMSEYKPVRRSSSATCELINASASDWLRRPTPLPSSCSSSSSSTPALQIWYKPAGLSKFNKAVTSYLLHPSKEKRYIACSEHQNYNLQVLLQFTPSKPCYPWGTIQSSDMKSKNTQIIAAYFERFVFAERCLSLHLKLFSYY